MGIILEIPGQRENHRPFQDFQGPCVATMPRLILGMLLLSLLELALLLSIPHRMITL